jgi:uncharacterized protein
MPKPAQNAFNNIQFLILLTVLMLTIVGAVMYYNSNFTFPGTAGGTVTVTGSSQSFERNRVAMFNATVTSVNTNKSTAVSEMNERVSALLDGLSQYGVDPKDIKTTNVSIYQEQYWDPIDNSPSYRDWRASTTVEIRLLRADQASEVSSMLASLDISEVFGPNFRIDGALSDDSRLLAMALEDARSKAESVANASGKRVGKMVSFVESGTSPTTGMYFGKEGYGGAADMSMEPGSTEMVKFVTVTFQLK